MTEPGRRPQVWGRVPPRNKDFTGREELLAGLRQQGGGTTAVLPTALHGLGGVGKTQIAIEFAHRHKSDYDVVWWIPSDQKLLVPGAIARLAPHLGLPESNETGVEETAEAVINALRAGQPFERWLLVFDNAHDPESLTEYIPDGPGDVIITSRNFSWNGVVRTLTVDVFSRQESRMFLDLRVPGIIGDEADALADALGDLPLALDQAGALQSETGMPVQEYLTLLKTKTGELMAEGRPMAYDVPLTATWSLSLTRLRQEHPDAVELIHLLAFFGADPIPRDVLAVGRPVVDDPLSSILADPLRFSRAVGALHRYALVQVDRAEQTLQVHRLVQALLREDVNDTDAHRYRSSVQHLLAAAALAKNTDDSASWPTFARLLPHISPSQAVESSDRQIRRLMRAVTRYLYMSGNAPAARSMAQQCLDTWSADPATPAEDLCAAKRHLGLALRLSGHYRQAYEVDAAALDQAVTDLGADHHETLLLTKSFSADLRAIGEFPRAYEVDEQLVERHRAKFGDSDERTLKAQNSFALDLTLTSRYQAAEDLLTHVYAAMRDLYGSPNHPTAQIVMNNLIRVIRLRGDYAEACELGEDIYAVGVTTMGADHPTTLKAANDLVIALRKAQGGSPEVVLRTEELVQRYRRLLGDQHPDKLAADMALVNVYREAGRLEEAVEPAELVILAYAGVYGSDHPYTHGCRGNLALLLRHVGQIDQARQIHQFVVERLTALLGDQHHQTLVCAVGLASDWAALGECATAVELGERTLEQLKNLLGAEHPMTLGCMANLGRDLAAVGRQTEAVDKRETALTLLRRRLGPSHPVVLTVAAGDRLDFDFDPPPI
ncbi:FxSxx-COOH system tetratricopeptide repeat protein [Actinomadura kijaniata]|uniref:FxSxx-COOH system tetratricopeptide repeat protein n=1 Tax=Actinomadura kijaniata TaxID=46161 RepID=UPI00082F5035|nr:FxSxx-COOH system tetratricopeptide repeat protein [Actinomadura kijaniata]